MVTLHVGVLGPLTVHDGAQEVRIAATKQRRLLGLLALRVHEVVGRDEIIDLLWPGRPPRSSSELVTGYISRLRRAGLRIDLVGTGYQLTADTDLRAFETHAKNGNLAQALDCWRGPIVAELRDHPFGIAITQRRVRVAMEFADQGDHALAVRHLQPLADIEPLHEGLHARLMLALAGDGHQAAALKLYRTIRSRLVDDLGIEPSAELRAAHQRVLHHSIDLQATLSSADNAIAAVRAAFTLSYRALDARTAALYQMLAVVPAPDFSLDLALSLAGNPRSLDQLVTSNLVQPTPDGRYTFHGLLRVLAAELPASLPTQLYDWCLANLCAAADALYPERFPAPVPRPGSQSSFTDAQTALTWLDTERQLLVGVVWKAPDTTAWQLAALLHGYFTIHPHIQDWETVATKALRSAEGHPQAQVLAEQSMSDVRTRQGNLPEALSHAQHALELSRSTGWLPGEINALVHLAFVQANAGELTQAAENAEALAALRPEAAAFVLGHIAFHRGDLDQADKHMTAAPHANSPGIMVMRLVALAEIQRERGNLGQAQRHLTQAQTVARQPIQSWVRTFLLRGLAELHSAKAEHTQALEYVHAAITAAATLGDPVFECETLKSLGTVCHRRGDHREAIKYYFRALDLARHTGRTYTQTATHLDLATAHHSLQDHPQALAHATQAARTARHAGFTRLLTHSEHLIRQLSARGVSRKS